MKLCPRKHKQRLDIFFIIPQRDACPLSPQTDMFMRELSELLEKMQVQGIVKGWGTEELFHLAGL